MVKIELTQREFFTLLAALETVNKVCRDMRDVMPSESCERLRQLTDKIHAQGPCKHANNNMAK